MTQVEVQVGLFPDYFETVMVDETLHNDPIGIALGLVGAEFETDLIVANVIYSANYPKQVRPIQQGIWY
jgi:hypothetical protein